VPETGVLLYRGPSLLTGAPIVAIASGLDGGSHNPKTGAMVQVWIVRSDLAPMDAVRANVDDAICGSCALRGRDGFDRKCYVAPWLGPNNVFKALDRYLAADDDEIAALLERRHVRIAAYGDPAAVPFRVWRNALRFAAGWTGYTHAWRTCDVRLQTIAMASVDSVAERLEASRAGWRTFRVRDGHTDAVQPDEVICPASDEAGHRTTCAACELCRGGTLLLGHALHERPRAGEQRAAPSWLGAGPDARDAVREGRAARRRGQALQTDRHRAHEQGRLPRTEGQRRSPAAGRWRAVHLVEWEKVHGPLPAGHALAFKNGDKTDRRLDNLECITRAALMARNSVHNLPKPLKQAVQLLGALNRQIRKRHSMPTNNVETLRTHLFDTLAALKDKDKPMDLDRARAIADVARVLVDSAKVEVDFLKVTGAIKSTGFLPDADEQPRPRRVRDARARLA
jgi:hypothetical protein